MANSEQASLWAGLAGQREGMAGESVDGSARPRLRVVNRAQVQMRVVEVERLIEEDYPARAIARLCETDPAYQWLTGMEPIRLWWVWQ